MGKGFAYATWIGEMFSYLDLRNKGITRWGAQGNFLVRHERIGSHRVVVAVLLYAVLGTLLGFAADAMANAQNVSLTAGVLALFALAISWLLIVDLQQRKRPNQGQARHRKALIHPRPPHACNPTPNRYLLTAMSQ
jgi:hypothetical protein